MATLHANSAEEVFGRILMLAQRGQLAMPPAVIHLEVGMARPFVIHIRKDHATHQRYVSEVIEVLPPATRTGPTATASSPRPGRPRRPRPFAQPGRPGGPDGSRVQPRGTGRLAMTPGALIAALAGGMTAAGPAASSPTPPAPRRRGCPPRRPAAAELVP